MKFTEEYRVRVSDLDYKRELSLNSIMKYFLETAFKHEDFMIESRQGEKVENYAWVIYKWIVNLDETACLGESLKVNTWLSKVDRFLLDRSFELINEKGERIAKAKSIWSMVNTESRSLMRIPKEMKLADQVVDMDFFPKDRKLPEIDEGLKCSKEEREVLTYDVDANNHMNNLAYLQKVIDSVPFELLDRHRIKSLEIVYKRELLPKEKFLVITGLQPNADMEVLSQIVNVDESVEYARVVVMLDNIEENYYGR